jgi:hypothetical protein
MAFSLSFFFRRGVRVNPVELPVVKQAVGETRQHHCVCVAAQGRFEMPRVTPLLPVKILNGKDSKLRGMSSIREEEKSLRGPAAHRPLQIDTFDTASLIFCIRSMNFP